MAYLRHCLPTSPCTKLSGNDELIVGGSFTESGGTPVNRIAKWDGSQWTALDFGFTESSPNDFIFMHTLKVIDQVLYIGGGLKELTYSDNSTEICNGIVSYDSNSIDTFDGGVPGKDIEAIIKTDSDRLLIGGGVFGSGYTGIMDLGTDIGGIEQGRDVRIFPNPFDRSINISAEDRFETYVLTDSQGRIIEAGPYGEQLNLDLMSGLYFLKLVGDNGFSTHKIIKR